MNWKPLAIMVTTIALMTSCSVEDPGPRQDDERRFTVTDFDRLEIGDGFHVEVRHGGTYSVLVRGDRRNLDDLVVRTNGETLVVRYDDYRQRRHQTYITITMPSLRAVYFSGGVQAEIDGFHDAGIFDAYLSGGSFCQLHATIERLQAVLSGGSHLSVRGNGDSITADLSGGSLLKAFSFPAKMGALSLSGASYAEISVDTSLDVKASGASQVRYRGTPVLKVEVSSASAVQQDR